MRISFGRYIPKNSIIHRLDPRFKIVMVIALIISIFFPIGFTGYLMVGAFILTIFAISRLNWSLLARLLVPISIMFLIILIMNFFFIKAGSLTSADIEAINKALGNDSPFHRLKHGAVYGDITRSVIDNVIKQLEQLQDKGNYQELIKDLKTTIPLGYVFSWKTFWFSEKAFYSALVMGMRIYLMITLTCILTGTTPSLQLTLAIEDLLSPLKIIKVPVYILSMIISIALRMIPTLIDEAGRIMKAQASRGIDIKNGKFKDKVKSLTSLIIPLLVSSFQKAEDLAYAMDARGYDPNARRTRFIQFKLKLIDLVLFVFGLSIAAFIIVYAINPADVFAFLHIARIDSLVAY